MSSEDEAFWNVLLDGGVLPLGFIVVDDLVIGPMATEPKALPSGPPPEVEELLAASIVTMGDDLERHQRITSLQWSTPRVEAFVLDENGPRVRIVIDLPRPLADDLVDVWHHYTVHHEDCVDAWAILYGFLWEIIETAALEMFGEDDE